MKEPNEIKIFLVDDVDICLKSHQFHLNQLGFTNVQCFKSGHQCLNELIQNPDVIFLDHEMPELSGVDVLKKIKRFNSDIFVVMVSGQDSIQIAVDTLKYGAFDYVVKNENEGKSIETVMNKIMAVMKLMESKQRGIKYYLKMIFPSID
jgi:FixJ family two-component response regulator